MSGTGPDTGDPRRRRGLAMMKQVYGWDVEHVEGDFMATTVDHLFGEVWANGEMSVRDRRLVILGILIGAGLDDVVALQLDAAVSLGELSDEELRELVLLVTHYVGWPSGTKLNTAVEQVLARHRRS